MEPALKAPPPLPMGVLSADAAPEVTLRPNQFCRCLATLDLDDIMEVADALRVEFGTADGEVAHWRAELAVAATLRRTHQQRAASLAAHRAGATVLAAAAWAHVEDAGRADVIAVARAAAEAARALVAGYPDARCSNRARPLLRPWQGVIDRVVERLPAPIEPGATPGPDDDEGTREQRPATAGELPRPPAVAS